MKDIPGYQGLYAATQDGQIWSYYKNNFLKPTPQEDGYLKVSLFKNGNKKTFYVHKLIALTYIPNLENKETVDHIDKNKLNNNYLNLRWATLSEQNKNKDWTEKMQEAVNKGGKTISRPVEMRDIQNHNILIQTFNSSYEAAIKKFNDPQKNSLINRCANGKKKSAYGYWWCFSK